MKSIDTVLEHRLVATVVHVIKLALVGCNLVGTLC